MFLRSKATQEWIAEFGRGRFDDQPLSFRIAPMAQESIAAGR